MAKCPICVLMEGSNNDYPNEHEEAYHKLREKIQASIEFFEQLKDGNTTRKTVVKTLEILLENA